MGDGADMALDNAWDDWEQKEEWVNNGSDPNEGYELGILNELGTEIGDSRLPSGASINNTGKKNASKYTKTGKRKAASYECRYCGKKNLKWVDENGKWRLYDKKQPHICKDYRKKDNDSI